MIRPGKIDRRVEFQRLDTTPDAYGNASGGTWSTVTTVWGELQFERSREAMEAGRLQSSVMATLYCRGLAVPTITTADKAVIGGEDYAIRSIVNQDGRNEKVAMVLERGVAP